MALKRAFDPPLGQWVALALLTCFRIVPAISAEDYGVRISTEARTNLGAHIRGQNENSNWKLADKNVPSASTMGTAPLVPFSIDKIAEIHTALLNDVWFSNDGSKIFAARDDGTSIVWQVAKGNGGFKVFECYRIIGDGSRCVDRGYGLEPSGVRVVGASTGKNLYTLSEDSNDDVVVSSDGSYIAVLSQPDGVINVFEAGSGSKLVRLTGDSFGFDKFFFSPDGSMLVACDSGQIILYELKPNKIHKIDVSEVRSFAVSTKGNLVGVISGFADPQILTIRGTRASQIPDDFAFKYNEVAGFMASGSKVVMNSTREVGIWSWKVNEIFQVPQRRDVYVCSE
jgi:WD40 repeat protein